MIEVCEAELAREIRLTDWPTAGNLSNRSSGVQIPRVIIQQIVTLSKYGHDALDICHPKVTDIQRYM